jgi:GNAT superfamily N-acetyltransferase
MTFRNAELKDKEFILNAHKEINILSDLKDSTFENRIDKELFEDKICKIIIAELDDKRVGFVLYSYIYWANCGKGIYLSQAYVRSEYRGQGIFRKLLKELENCENDCNFITNLVGLENEGMKNTLNRLDFSTSDLTTYYRMIKR